MLLSPRLPWVSRPRLGHADERDVGCAQRALNISSAPFVEQFRASFVTIVPLARG